MAVESLSERPIFASEENEYLIPSRPPLSRMALAACGLGIVSALVLINADLMVLPILAVSVGLAAYWMISRSDALSGRNLALAGVGLGLLFGVWSVTTVQLRNRYLYQVGAQFAKHYLDTIAQGKLLEAFELMQPESARQVAGSSLEKHYGSLDEMARSGLEMFEHDPSTLKVKDRGTGAQWQLKEGVSVGRLLNQEREVVLRMVDASRPSAGVVEVALMRHFSQSVASWRVSVLK
jgi:hypothetical protein